MKPGIIPDVTIAVRFLTTSEGGRQRAVQGEYYGCPLLIDSEGFECRLLLYGRRLELGSTYDVPVKFFFPEYALQNIFVGKEVLLWEGKIVANGTVIDIVRPLHGIF